MSIENKLKLLSHSFVKFTEEYNKVFPLLQSTANNYKNDFSLLCQQEYIDALGIFPSAQFEIKTLLEEFIDEAQGTLDDATLHALQSQLSQLNEYDFKALIYRYVNACNTFITLFKVPKIDTLEEKRQLAEPVLKEWEAYMNAMNRFINTLQSLKEIFTAIS